jgi:hypothetical protein
MRESVVSAPYGTRPENGVTAKLAAPWLAIEVVDGNRTLRPRKTDEAASAKREARSAGSQARSLITRGLSASAEVKKLP